MQKYSKDEREVFIREWRASEKSAVIFCAEKGINKNTFQYWLIKEKKSTKQGFVEITKTKNLHIEHGLSIELGKLKVNFPSGNNKEELEAVIKILWALVC